MSSPRTQSKNDYSLNTRANKKRKEEQDRIDSFDRQVAEWLDIAEEIQTPPRASMVSTKQANSEIKFNGKPFTGTLVLKFNHFWQGGITNDVEMQAKANQEIQLASSNCTELDEDHNKNIVVSVLRNSSRLK